MAEFDDNPAHRSGTEESDYDRLSIENYHLIRKLFWNEMMFAVSLGIIFIMAMDKIINPCYPS